MNDAGLGVSEEDMHPWHGADKAEVVRHFLERAGKDQALAGPMDADFIERLKAAYLEPGSPLSLIDPSLPDFCEDLRARGIKVGLNTVRHAFVCLHVNGRPPSCS